MMTLEEAIIHCEKKAGANTDCSAECSAEHRQLAEWLKELPELKRNSKDKKD